MLDVTPIPAFSDNYIWCAHRPGDTEAVVVDPGDGNAVLEALAERGLSLAGIIITHHHFDHTGGLDVLLSHADVPVFGPHNEAISQIGTRLADGERVNILGLEWQILGVPGHTLDHIAFYNPDSQVLFCGDTLFAGGCGRVFEGNPAMMLESLDKLAALPPETRVFCAHEYTMANLAFAAAVEPDNEALKARISRDSDTRERGEPTVPSTLSLELDTNPFLRCRTASVAEQMKAREGIDAGNPVAVFGAVRGWKDHF